MEKGLATIKKNTHTEWHSIIICSNLIGQPANDKTTTAAVIMARAGANTTPGPGNCSRRDAGSER